MIYLVLGGSQIDCGRGERGELLEGDGIGDRGEGGSRDRGGGARVVSGLGGV